MAKKPQKKYIKPLPFFPKIIPEFKKGDLVEVLNAKNDWHFILRILESEQVDNVITMEQVNKRGLVKDTRGFNFSQMSYVCKLVHEYKKLEGAGISSKRFNVRIDEETLKESGRKVTKSQVKFINSLYKKG